MTPQPRKPQPLSYKAAFARAQRKAYQRLAALHPVAYANILAEERVKAGIPYQRGVLSKTRWVR